ncbi:hypothetical protein CAC42_3662 [Sphaceloma murrayae]|uniref:Uncharacterized protein n=1 Tax=Sphaceloma murrayae TaxID=2082308 RepID=A0A2K1QPY6_9PEZI|nr:hypothetical protein CAC42_3662 [Sphaceloma murrayae]
MDAELMDVDLAGQGSEKAKDILESSAEDEAQRDQTLCESESKLAPIGLETVAGEGYRRK